MKKPWNKERTYVNLKTDICLKQGTICPKNITFYVEFHGGEQEVFYNIWSAPPSNVDEGRRICQP